MNARVITLLISTFLDILGFSFIFPIIPFIVRDFWGNAFVTGIAISSAAIGMVVGGVIFGKLSDIYGRKKILIITVILNILGYIAFGYAGSLILFCLARFLCGLGWGGMAVTQAYLWDISTDKDRIVNMGYVWAAVGIWFTLGPIFGSLVYGWSLKEIGFISAIILFLSLLNIIFFLPKHEDVEIQTIPKYSLKGLQSEMYILFVIYFTVTLAFAGMQTVLALFLSSRFGFESRNIAYIFWLMGIVGIIYQGILIKYTARYLTEKRMIIIWLASLSGAMMLVGLSHNIYLSILGLTIAVMGLCNVNSTVLSMITGFSHKKDYGKNMWINSAFGSLADATSPIATGFLYAAFGPMIAFWSLGLILFVNLVIVWQRLQHTNNVAHI